MNWDLSYTYPSQYTTTEIIILSIIITIMMIIVVVGNMLVIIAIATEHSLNTVQNWFIASLAFADLSLGLIIMPFSLAHEVTTREKLLESLNYAKFIVLCIENSFHGALY